MKIVTLSPTQFDKFAKTHRYRNYYQTSAYGNVMTKFGYNIHYLGITSDENKLIGASLLIYKEVFMNNKIAYAPRGFLFNYEKLESVKELVTVLKKVLGKQGFMFLRIDPYIPMTIRDNEGNIMNLNNQVSNMINNLQAAGFTYKGKNLFFETEKPRWESLILLNQDIREIFAKFDKRTRNKIRKATNSGIEIYKEDTNSKKDLTKLYEFIKKKSPKPIEFYEQLCKSYKENIDIYYAKLNTETFIINSRKTYEKEIEINHQLAEKIQNMTLEEKERNSFLNKKMASDQLLTIYKNNLILATNLLKKYPAGLLVGGAIVINYDNAAYIYMDGIDEKYTALNASYLLKWRMIEDYQKKHYKYLNLNAIVGEFNQKNKYSGLNEMKLGFNTIITEYIGQFDIVLNSFTYNLYNSFNKKNTK